MDKADVITSWARSSEGPSYKILSGMAFEAVCLKHVDQIKNGLELKGRSTTEASWRYIPSKGAKEDGAQIDRKQSFGQFGQEKPDNGCPLQLTKKPHNQKIMRLRCGPVQNRTGIQGFGDPYTIRCTTGPEKDGKAT